jgi:hypothetical protein
MEQIRINGVIFGEGCATTIRVALICLREDLNINGLGKDPIGKDLSDAYLENIDLILRVMEDEKDR